MALVDFIYTGAVQVWTVPDGVTEVECWIAGGGTTFDYWPDYPNGWTYSPYILTVPAWGWYIPNLPVTPGDVLGITIGGCSQLHEEAGPTAATPSTSPGSTSPPPATVEEAPPASPATATSGSSGPGEVAPSPCGPTTTTPPPSARS